MQKKERQDLIVEIISAEPIPRQAVLVRKLTEHGLNVTQASVSRDLEELGIVKNDGVYVLPAISAAAREFGLRSLEPAGDNLLVGKCDSGLASAITVRIDAAGIDSIIGTIAGDDTIFIATGDRARQTAAITRISQLFTV